MSRTFLVCYAIVWGLFGVVCFAAPAAMLRGFGIELSTPDALTEVRATYGGAQLGVAAFLAYSSRHQSFFEPALLLFALMMGGFAASRIAGVLIDGATGPFTIGSIVLEMAVAGSAVFALRSSAPLPKSAA